MKDSNETAGIHIPERSQWVNTILDSLGNDVVATEQEGFILYYKSGSYAEENNEHLIQLVNSSIERVKKILKLTKLTKGFYLVILDSEEEMQQIIGMHVKGLSSGRNNAALFVYNPDIRPYFKHELFHLVSYNVWGLPSNRLLDEGGAVYCDNECLYYNNPISTINKYLYENNRWFNLTDLINNFSEKAGENDLIAYLESAFIFRYLYQYYGSDKLQKLWREGFNQFDNIYGFDIPELEKKIQAELDKIELMQVDWYELMDKGCG